MTAVRVRTDGSKQDIMALERRSNSDTRSYIFSFSCKCFEVFFRKLHSVDLWLFIRQTVSPSPNNNVFQLQTLVKVFMVTPCAHAKKAFGSLRPVVLVYGIYYRFFNSR